MKQLSLISGVSRLLLALLTGALLLEGSQALAQVTSAAAEPRFNVTGFQVEGAHALDQAEIDRTLAPYLGPARSFGDLEQAVAALKHRYGEAGFSSVNIVLPEQEVSQGVIRVQVVEARIGAVSVVGNRFFDEANVLHGVPALQPGVMPNMDQIADQVRMSNDNPSKQVQITLRQGQTAQTTDAVVRVADEDPLQFAVVADNTGTASSGRARLGFAVHDSNMFDLDHVLSAQFQTSPERLSDVAIFGANYLIPLYAYSETLDFSLGYSNVNSGLVTTTAGAYGITGKGDTLGTQFTQYLARSDVWNNRVFAALDWRAYKNDVSAGGSGPSLVPDVTVHPITLGYAVNYKSAALDGAFTLAYVHNIPGGANGSTADFRQPGGRADADASYQLVHYGLVLGAAVFTDWRITLDVDGQLTRDALVTPEQFGAGGVDSVRGFDERAATDDRGVHSTLQIETPDEAPRLLGEPWQLRAVAFYDAAKLTRVDALPGEVSSFFISSAGAGLRGAYGTRTSLRLDLADVINGATLRPKHATMVHASLLWTF